MGSLGSACILDLEVIGARAMKVLTTEMLGEVQDVRGRIFLEHSIIKRQTTKDE